MPIVPEREPHKSVQEFQEDASPLRIEKKEVVTPVPSQFTQKVTDDSGQVLTQSPKTKTVAITLPKDQEQLKNLSKGKITESITWFAAYWLRMIKKAVHFGWQIITGQKTESQETKAK